MREVNCHKIKRVRGGLCSLMHSASDGGTPPVCFVQRLIKGGNTLRRTIEHARLALTENTRPTPWEKHFF